MIRCTYIQDVQCTSTLLRKGRWGGGGGVKLKIGMGSPRGEQLAFPIDLVWNCPINNYFTSLRFLKNWIRYLLVIKFSFNLFQ